MVKGTLNYLTQLRFSSFGQPPPRHGLNLLYWFAKEYISIGYGAFVLRYRPENGDFGFKKFQNRIEDEDYILPVQDLLYYEVGNLNATGAENLPHYVRANYDHNIPNSNKDRIIVRLDNDGNVNRVYLTEYIDQTHFDSSKTYRVSQGLLQMINIISRESFLFTVTQQSTSFSGHADTRQQPVRPPPPRNDFQCAIF